MIQTGPKISVIGHASIDYLLNVQDIQPSTDDLNISFHVDAEKYYGGTGMNVAYAAAKMGGDIRFLTCVGDDFKPPNDFSDNIILRTIKYHNLEEPRTPTCFIFNANENQVTYISDNTLEHYNGIEDSHMYDDTQCVHLTTTPIDFSIRTAQQTQDKSDAVVSWSPGQNLRLWDLDSFKHMIKNVNVLFVNEHEMDIIVDKFDIDMTELMRTMSTSHDRLIIVTRGSQGALLRHHRYLTPFEIDAIPIDHVVDTTGCGDAFTGAFLSQMFDCKMTLPNCLRFASSVASFVAEKEGSQTNIPTFDEAFERMNKYYEVK